MRHFYTLLFFIVLIATPLGYIQAKSSILTPEEIEWLESKNNTITVIPERNNPPFAFNDTSWKSQGIFIDYINLVAKKLDVKVDFLMARTRLDVIDALKQGKGDYIGNLGADKAKELSLPHSAPYFNTPVVIVVRNDYVSGTGLTLDDLHNKKVSVLAGSVVELFIKKTHPKIILEEVFDNELVLQKIVLAEVDAAVINLASLSYYMSKQSIKSIKVVGNVPGFDVNLAFTTSNNEPLLNSILEKGLAQITPEEREDILQKWQDTPIKKVNKEVNSLPMIVLYTFSIIGIFALIFILVEHKRRPQYISKKGHPSSKLEEDIMLLEDMNKMLIKKLEDDIKEKVQNTENNP